MNHIGINTEDAKNLAEKLNLLLANYQVFYTNVRGYHWNIKGEKFFELHTKFEELYNDLFLKIDEIAERIVTLGVQPLHSFSEYLSVSEIKEVIGVSNGIEAMNGILSAWSVLLGKQREILELADESNDEGTNALMSDYIREQEKEVWMYKGIFKLEYN